MTTTPDPLRAALSLVAYKIEVARPSTKVFGADNAQVTLRVTDLLTIYAALASIPAPAPIPPAPTVWYQCSACGWTSAMGPDCERPKDCPACGVTYMTGSGAHGPWLSGPWAVDPRTLDSAPALDRREVVARIIDPHEWSLHDFGQSREPPAALGTIAGSLLKADAIIAALQAPGEK